MMVIMMKYIYIYIYIYIYNDGDNDEIILAYVRSDLLTRQRPDLEFVESIIIEATVYGRKLAIVCAFRPSSMHNCTFIDDFTSSIDIL